MQEKQKIINKVVENRTLLVREIVNDEELNPKGAGKSTINNILLEKGLTARSINKGFFIRQNNK